MRMAPQYAEAPVKIQDGISVLGTQLFSAHQNIAVTKHSQGMTNEDEVHPALIGAELMFSANSDGTTDSLQIRVYGSWYEHDANPRVTRRNFAAAKSFILDTTSGNDTFYSMWVDWKDVIAGLVVGLVRTGSTDTIVTTTWMRRFRMGNPATK